MMPHADNIFLGCGGQQAFGVLDADMKRPGPFHAGSTVCTDGLNSYREMEDYVHHRQVQHRLKNGEHLLPRVHRAVSLLKRWMLGTHQGAIGHQHLDDYLNEFVFRFNRRKSASRGKLFFRLAQHALQITPTTYESLVRPQDVE